MSAFPQLKLAYFDFDGGRGEAIRLALVLGKIPFEDDRLSLEAFLARKAEFPYGAMPVLFIDSKPLAQSNAIARYVGRLTELYPSDPWQAAICDEILDTVEEITMHIGATMPLGDGQKKERRLKLIADVFPALFVGLESRLKASGGDFFGGQHFNVADLKTSDTVGWLRSGVLEHIPKDLVDTSFPLLAAHQERVKGDPRISGYYASRAKA